MHRPSLFPALPSRALAARTAAVLILAATTVLTLSAPAQAAEAPAPADQTYSVAETRLFMTDHLSKLSNRATVLQYRFTKSGSYEPGYEDKVTLEVAASDPKAQGGRSVNLEFLSGEHKTELPALEGAKGNPVILGFLERDLREMKRITGGQPNYYRKRLRLAMVDTHELKPVMAKWGGKEVKAESMTLDPYKDDPARSRFGRFANKLYTFVLSDEVPGGVLSLKTVMRDGSNTGKIMIEETLTLMEPK